MHLLIIGGTGFIGRNFTRKAISSGHNVTIVARNLPASSDQIENVEYVAGGIQTLSRNIALISRSDAVCHCASSTIPASANSNPISDVEENVVGMMMFLESMTKTSTKRILYLSSGGAVYGRATQNLVKEDHALRPISAYGVSKVTIENYLGYYKDQYGLNPVILRPSNPYGPGQYGNGQLGLVSTLIHAAETGRPAQFWGDGSIVRDYIYVSDLCELMLTAIESHFCGVYNAGSGVGSSVQTVAETVERISKKQISREYLPKRPFDPPKIVLDSDLARTTFGWQAHISLDDGIRQTLSSIRR